VLLESVQQFIMSNYFNPANPRFRRGIMLISVYICSFAGVQIVLFSDFGSQEHVFSPVIGIKF